MPNLSATALERMRLFIKDHPLNPHGPALLAIIDRALKPKRGTKIRRERRELKKLIRAKEVQDLRTIVATRAGGKCENCGKVPLDFGLELDHFFGGSNRRFLESVETTWMLCGGIGGCHEWKTRLRPSAEYWFEAFITHARLHGYLRAVSRAQARLQFVQTRKKLSTKAMRRNA